MKFARFSINETIHYGIAEGDNLKVITGNIYGKYSVTEQVIPMTAVKLLAPVVPSKIIGVGLNYKAVALAKGTSFPDAPILFLKPPSSVIGPQQEIVITDNVKTPAFEVELAVVIGKQTKNIAAAKALDCVFGYTLTNDVTAKDHMIKGQPWARGKSFDTFTPLGAFIETELNPADVDLTLTVNGIQKQSGNTSDMIFDVKAIIAFVSSIMTLEVGDVILTGTPPGGGVFAKGDVLRLSSPQIGYLENKVI
jgi:2-keto-4-pentenoate hydratase/2-oxohepta-3-ene-1,7-dioic acid hydratase in catechol pathway